MPWIKKCRGKILTEKIMKLVFQMIKSMNTVCFVCKLQHFLKKKTPHSFSILLLLQILISVHMNSFSVVKIGSEEGEKKNTRKKDIYVVIYAKHKIFVDKMFNIFVRHS